MDRIKTFLRDYWPKLLRYAGVSVIAVIVGQTLLYLFNEPLDRSAVTANLLAVTLATIPSYILNRAWVWGKSGNHSVTAELSPFWGMAFLGLLLSTIAVHLVEQATDFWVYANLANLSAFGVLWVAKFFILDRVLFAATDEDSSPAAPEAAHPAG